ncbi:MAG TPA: hypothetical protein VD862_03395 [Candidatus Paceibacterota bacterium]|nr:hypothetical protein [Candidatus Paceibacterota bacterium]
MPTYDGVLDNWWETGTEGVVWVLASDTEDEQALLYGNLFLLEAGDHLTVWGPDGGFVFDDVIDPDYEAGWMPFPRGVRPPEGWRRYSPLHRVFYRFKVFCATRWVFLPGALQRLMRRFLNGQPTALGFWIHWTQRGWEPEKWASLFLVSGKERPYRARVVRREDT